MATERDGIRLIDVSNPASPTEVGAADPGGEMRDVAVRGGLVFAANGEGGVTVLQNNLFTAGEDGPERRGGLALWPNAPNPVRGTTAIRFELAAPGDVTVEVYTLLGQRIATVTDEARGAGPHTVSFDASGLASGDVHRPGPVAGRAGHGSHDRRPLAPTRGQGRQPRASRAPAAGGPSSGTSPPLWPGCSSTRASTCSPSTGSACPKGASCPHPTTRLRPRESWDGRSCSRARSGARTAPSTAASGSRRRRTRPAP